MVYNMLHLLLGGQLFQTITFRTGLVNNSDLTQTAASGGFLT